MCVSSLLRTFPGIICTTTTTSPLLTLYHKTCPLHTNSECGKIEVYINWSMVVPEKLAHVTRTTSRTIGTGLADSRQ